MKLVKAKIRIETEKHTLMLETKE